MDFAQLEAEIVALTARVVALEAKVSPTAAVVETAMPVVEAGPDMSTPESAGFTRVKYTPGQTGAEFADLTKTQVLETNPEGTQFVDNTGAVVHFAAGEKVGGY